LVAVLIFHGRSDLDWASAITNELAEHAPVRFQLASTPPKVTFGPSVVRVGLWSDESRAEDLDRTMAELLQAEPAHAVLARRGDCAPPTALDCARLARDVTVLSAREAAEMLRDAIPEIAASAAKTVSRERERVVAKQDGKGRAADLIALGLLVAVLAAGAWYFDWGGVREWVARLLSPQ